MKNINKVVLKRERMPIRMVLLGFTGSGKRSSQNTILGLGPPLTNHKKAEGHVAGRHVTVVDTSGWYRNMPVLQTPELVRKEIEYSVFQCVPGPHAFLLVVNVDAPFRQRDKQSVLDHMELLGGGVWGHTMLLFTCGDWLGDTTIEEHIESEGEALQRLVEKCGNRYHVLSNVNKGDGSQVTELLEKIEKMVAENGEEPFYQVKPDVLLNEGDSEAEEEDWKYVWQTTQSMTSKGKNSIGFPPPSFGSEDRSSSSCSLRSSKFSPKRTTQSSAYGSLKSTWEFDRSSPYGRCKSVLRSTCSFEINSLDSGRSSLGLQD